jgi:vancomycin resistance protein VanJ
VLAWLLLFGSPAAGDRLHRLVWAGSLAYLVAAAGAAALLWGLGDRWWPATVLLFGPRWTLLLPIAILLPAALRWDRLMLFPLVLATWLVVVPVMGFVSGWRAWLATGWDTAPELGVVTFNARGGDGLRLTAAGMLREWRADIAGFQECGGVLRRELLALSDEDGWHTDARASLCLASRFPIVAVEEMEREAFEFAGGSALVVTWTMALNERDVVHVTNLHLETPRAGLGRIRRGRLGSGARLVTERSYLRALELERARRWTLHFAGPHLVLGDFNTPVESAAYREAWGDWQNAFSRVGVGLGGTRLNGWIRARIDHVLVDANWRLVGAWTAGDLGSDHLPMKAAVRPAWRFQRPEDGPLALPAGSP